MDPQDDWETMAQVQQKPLLLKSRAIETSSTTDVGSAKVDACLFLEVEQRGDKRTSTYKRGPCSAPTGHTYAG